MRTQLILMLYLRMRSEHVLKNIVSHYTFMELSACLLTAAAGLIADICAHISLLHSVALAHVDSARIGIIPSLTMVIFW